MMHRRGKWSYHAKLFIVWHLSQHPYESHGFVSYEFVWDQQKKEWRKATRRKTALFATIPLLMEVHCSPATKKNHDVIIGL